MTQQVPKPVTLPPASREALLALEKSELVDIVLLALQGHQQATENMQTLNSLLAEERQKNQDLQDKLTSQEAELITLRSRPT